METRQPHAPPALTLSAEQLGLWVESVASSIVDYSDALEMANLLPSDRLTGEQIRTLDSNTLRQWSNMMTLLRTLHFDLHNECPWRKLGIPRLEGPEPTPIHVDMRRRQAHTLLDMSTFLNWSEGDKSLAQKARQTFQEAYEQVSHALPEVTKLRQQTRQELTPPYAEMSPQLLTYLSQQTVARGNNWHLAGMLSNLQGINLSEFPRLMPVPQARLLHEAMIRGGRHGDLALSQLSNGGVVMWAPSNTEHLHRMLATYQKVSARSNEGPTLILLTLHEHYPGILSADMLMDLCRHPIHKTRWQALIKATFVLPHPARCVTTGRHGPRTVDKACTLFVISTAPESQPPLLAEWRLPFMHARTGPTVCMDGPADCTPLMFRLQQRVHLPGVLAWEGPLRSYGSGGDTSRVLFKVYFETRASQLILDIATATLQRQPEATNFYVGSQNMFNDPTAMRVELPALETITNDPELLGLIDQAVVVSPQLILIHTHADQATWKEALTAMQRHDPEQAIFRITWRQSHNKGEVWAAPQVLPAQAQADRIRARGRRQPAGADEYRSELLLIKLTSALGPSPESILAELIAQIQLALGTPISRAPGNNGLQPHQFREKRDGTGAWDGSLQLRLPRLEEAKLVTNLLDGATLDIDGALSPFSCTNPRLNSTNANNASTMGNGRGS